MNKAVYLGAIGVMAVVVAVLGYKLSQKTDVVEVQQGHIENLDLERNNLTQELEIMALRYDTMKTGNQMLQAELLGQRELVSELQGKLKSKGYSLSKARKEAETLRSIMKDYIGTIDSLNQLNIALIAERDQIAAEMDVVRGNNDNLRGNLEDSEQIIAEGQVLQALNFQTEAVKLRNNGSQSATSRASKAEMVKSCFSIMANRIASVGTKELYMQITGPDGKILPTSNGVASALLDGNNQQFSVKRNIDYQRQEMDVCIFYTVSSELPEGDYKVTIFENGLSIGSSSLSLR